MPPRDAAGLGDARRAALDAALRDGVPGTRSERWKYTPLRALERRAFAASDAPCPSTDAGLLAAIPTPRIVFVNGRFDATHTDLAGLARWRCHAATAVASCCSEGDARESNFLARRFDRADEVFARLNAALADDGVVLRAEAGAQGDAADPPGVRRRARWKATAPGTCATWSNCARAPRSAWSSTTLPPPRTRTWPTP